ncbi:MAG: stage IV sporulation protein A [Desulfitibacter sp. BRH_c19]|nr:MAG: stage IV sporulation protein A [Desulfitibacter sp. BRH_c19]
MDNTTIFRDIAERTGGDIYLGVVGPVRTGKSTFIKKFMELMVIPNIENPNDRDRARDELPQSGAGKTIMTTEPKFIPADAVEVKIKDGLKMNVRVVDCVGYTVEGAKGYGDEDGPRMVRTPWFEDDIPFQEAAEFGTKKVIEDHSTMGLVVFTDGSISDIPRENYESAEERVIWELQSLNKPFIIILNSANPYSEETYNLANSLEEQYRSPVLPMDVSNLKEEDIMNILEEALYEFPVVEISIDLPLWIDELDEEHWLRVSYQESVNTATENVKKVRDIDNVIETLSIKENVSNVVLKDMNLGTGTAYIDVSADKQLYFKVLEEETGHSIHSEQELMKLMKELSIVKKDYDKIATGLNEVRNTGYGTVTPTLAEMILEEPELIKQGRGFGVKLKATAPSYHLIRANITTEITPLIGTEKQCEELIQYIVEEFEENPQKIWDTNIFGKSLYDLTREGIQGKLYRMPENAQEKLQETLERIVNDGSGGLICIII